MKINTPRLYAFAWVLFLAATWKDAAGQLPVCGSGNQLIYQVNGGKIYNFNPFLPLSAGNPVLNTISLPPNANGLAVSRNINDPAGSSPVFYSVKDNYYYYYDGAAWVNTGHKTVATNPCGAGPYIYNLLANRVYKYDGTGDDQLLLTLPITDLQLGPVADLIGDCEGNFYVLKCTNPDPWLRKYDPNGNLLQEWTITNPPHPNQGGGGGYAIIGNLLIMQDLISTYSGIIGTNSVTLSPFANAITVSDMGSCPIDGLVSSTKDTVYACDASGVSVTAQGSAPYSYSLVGGSANIISNGADFTIVPNTRATVVLHSTIHSSCSGSRPHTDTYYVVPPPVVDAGADDTLYGCSEWLGTLRGTLRDTVPWANYTIAWTPAAAVSSNGSTLSPEIAPPANTTYVIEVTTGPAHGNCVLKDSVHIATIDKSVTAGYTYTRHSSCSVDTLYFTNTSTNYTNVAWDFGDGHSSHSANPIHLYPARAQYRALLTVRNAYCEDTVSRIINTSRVLQAMFTVSADSVCQSGKTAIRFINASGGASAYSWDFGDGAGSILQDPEYTYAKAGVHTVTLIAIDSNFCRDTATQNIYVDSTPFVHLLTDTAICEGDEINLKIEYLQPAVTVHWDLGDGTHREREGEVIHSYNREGVYTVYVQAAYPVCPPAEDSADIAVYALPRVYLGPDTTICPDASVISLANLLSAPDISYRSLWNTGAISGTIKITRPGTYSLMVATLPAGCSAADTITIGKSCFTAIPNVFTPNGDGVNDYFFPGALLSHGVTAFHMQVFNRWGQLLFETDRIDGRGWDGTTDGILQPEGVYVYLIDVRYTTGAREVHKGNVTLLR